MTACDHPGCDYSTIRKADLARHQRKHSGEKPYTCKWPGCTKAFIQSAQLRDHDNVHSGNKPHVCTNCGASFADKSSLNRHRHIHDPNKCYRCHYRGCDRKDSSRRDSMEKHFRDRHMVLVENCVYSFSILRLDFKLRVGEVEYKRVEQDRTSARSLYLCFVRGCPSPHSFHTEDELSGHLQSAHSLRARSYDLSFFHFKPATQSYHREASVLYVQAFDRGSSSSGRSRSASVGPRPSQSGSFMQGQSSSRLTSPPPRTIGYQSTHSVAQMAPQVGAHSHSATSASNDYYSGSDVQTRMDNLAYGSAYGVQASTTPNQLGLVQGDAPIATPPTAFLSVPRYEDYEAQPTFPNSQDGATQDLSGFSVPSIRRTSPPQRPQLNINPSPTDPYQRMPQLTNSSGRSKFLSLPPSYPTTPHSMTVSMDPWLQNQSQYGSSPSKSPSHLSSTALYDNAYLQPYEDFYSEQLSSTTAQKNVSSPSTRRHSVTYASHANIPYQTHRPSRSNPQVPSIAISSSSLNHPSNPSNPSRQQSTHSPLTPLTSYGFPDMPGLIPLDVTATSGFIDPGLLSTRYASAYMYSPGYSQ